MNVVQSEAAAVVKTGSPLRMVVVCRSEETASRWRSRSQYLDGLEVVTELGCRSYFQLINRIIAEGHNQPVVLCHGDIRCGLDFSAAIHELLNELAHRFTNWGVCGNAGITWDGRQIFRYVREPHGGLQQSLAPEPVLSIDGNLMLLNVPALVEAGVEVPDLGGFHGYDIALSLECLRRGLPVLCDRRLFVMHRSGGDNDAFQKFSRSPVFQNYVAQRFLNHTLPTINGFVDVSTAQSYSYLDIPTTGCQQDIVELFDRTLAQSRIGRPTVTIGCRTQFKRNDLLMRALASFAVAAQQAPELIELRVRIISDQPADKMAAELVRLRQHFPGLDLDGYLVPRTTERYSRTEALLTAIEKSETDYIWFVDDDDYVLPGAIRPLARALARGVPRLAVGHSRQMEEIWTVESDGSRRFKTSRQIGLYSAAGVFRAFSGDNHTPICSVVFPVSLLRERLRNIAARGDYCEDYFLLLLALSSARVEVRLIHEDFCGISLRPGENTVLEPDREHWDLSYATFMSELLRHPEGTSPLMWQLGCELEYRGVQIASLSQTVAERNAQITDLSQAVAERDGQLSAVYRSRSWIVTSPLRWSHKLLAYAIDHVKFLWRDRFVPLRGLEPLADGRWRALDEDPQFDVRLSKFGLGRGWYRVEIEGQGLQQPKLYLGCGNDDYNGSECYPLISRKGRFEANLRLNEPVFRVRFDPRKIPGEFTLRKLVIRRRWIFGILADKAITIYRRDRQRGMSPIAIGAHYWAVVRQLGPRQLIAKLNHLPATPNSDTKGDVELTYEQWINRVEKAYFTDLKEKSAPAATRKHVFFVFVTSRSASWLPSVLRSLTAQKMASWRATIFCEDIEAGYFHAFPAEDERIRFERFGSDELKLELARLSDETVTLISPGASPSPYYLLALEQKLSGCADKQYIVYTDNDLLDSHGSRFDPNFKPDWSPDYFLEYDYVGGVISVSAPLLANSRVYACPEAELAAWWVLLQQAVGRLCANVLHIPFVLFHREEQMEESYRLEHRQQLLNEELKPFGASAVTGKHQATFRIQYSPPDNEPSVTIIIPTRDRVDLLQRCISTLVEKTHYSNYELVIVDNQSCEAQTKRYLTKIVESEKVRVLQYDHPFNFSAINNFAVEQTESDLLCFLNNDIEIIDSDWLTEMVSREKQPGTGCVGVKLLYPNGNVQHAGVLIGKGGVAGHIFRGRDPEATGYQNRLVTVQNYSAVTAACLLTPRELFVKLGGFNEQHLAVAFNDVDYCLRVREAGLKVCWTPHVRLVHHESESRGDDADRIEAFAQEIRFMKVRWSRWIMNDPAYNRHLALSDAEFGPSARWLHREEQRPGRESLNPARELYAFESNTDRARLVLAGTRSFDTSKHFSPGLSVVVLTLEKPELIGPLLEALVEARQILQRNFGLEMEIIIGDTGSKRDDVRSIYAKHEREIRLENGMRYHFSRCNNDLFERHVNYDKVLFLNNDIVFSDASAQLLEMCRVLDRESATGVLGTQLMYPDGRLQHGGVDIFKTGELKGLCYHPGHGQEIKSFLPVGETQAFPAVTGACLLIRSSLFSDCGGFDERYSAEAQDVDLCMKAKRLGWNTKLVHVGKVIHIENATRTKGEENNQDRARFVRKWSGFYEVAF